MSSNIQIIKTCSYCGSDFTAQTLHTRYCSHTCNRRHYKQIKRAEKLQLHNQTKLYEARRNINKPDYDLIQCKQFLSIKETACLLGASTRTIQRLITKGELKIGKVGKRSIIQRSELDKLFQ